MKTRLFSYFIILIILFASGCIPLRSTQSVNFPTGNVEATSAAETIQVFQTEFANLTQDAGDVEEQKPSRKRISRSQTPLPPTATLIIPTHTLAPSITPLATSTPIATLQQPRCLATGSNSSKM